MLVRTFHAGFEAFLLEKAHGYCVIKLRVWKVLERVKGIEPSYEAWEAAVLPLNYTRVSMNFSAVMCQ
jgi:hypothetical protein